MIECESCHRHYRPSDPSCPFCRTTTHPAIWAMNLLGGALTTVVLAACYGTAGFDKYYYTPSGLTGETGGSGLTDTTPLPTGETGGTGLITATGDTGIATQTGDTGLTGGSGLTAGDTGTTIDTDTGSADTGTPVDTGDPQLNDVDQDGYSVPWDCNDTDPTIHPDFPEQCADSIDNDCDGLIDSADPECP